MTSSDCSRLQWGQGEERAQHGVGLGIGKDGITIGCNSARPLKASSPDRQQDGKKGEASYSPVQGGGGETKSKVLFAL